MKNDDTAGAVLSVEDRLAIQELTHRYAFYIDHFDLEPLLELWTEDAWFDERPVGLLHSVGSAKIREFFVDDFEARESSAHFMTNHILEGTGEDAAQGTCFGLIEANLASGQSLRATVTYTDTYAKQDGRWLFTSRTVRPLATLDLGDLTESIAGESA